MMLKKHACLTDTENPLSLRTSEESLRVNCGNRKTDLDRAERVQKRLIVKYNHMSDELMGLKNAFLIILLMHAHKPDVVATAETKTDMFQFIHPLHLFPFERWTTNKDFSVRREGGVGLLLH